MESDEGEGDGQSWLKTFLEPLNNDWKPTPSTRAAKPSYLNDGEQLVGKFSSSLGKVHCRTLEEKSEAVGLAKKSLIDILNPEVDFKELERRLKRYKEALNIKSDLEKSGSVWTIEMLDRYLKPEDFVFVDLPSHFDLTDGTLLQKIFERVDLAIKAVCGREGTVEKLNKLHSQPHSTEFDARNVLDAILQPLCVYKGLTVRSEQTIKSDQLPSNRYDYIMYWNGEPIGVVEAKRQGSLKADSVAQLFVQLLLLSFEDPNMFYFGVLSDAYQFIFVGIFLRKVMFFQTKENQLEITTVKSDDDVSSIVGKISLLIDLAIQSRESDVLIEEFLTNVAALKI